MYNHLIAYFAADPAPKLEQASRAIKESEDSIDA